MYKMTHITVGGCLYKAKFGKIKTCLNCGGFNWYERERCVNCGGSQFRRTSEREVLNYIETREREAREYNEHFCDEIDI